MNAVTRIENKSQKKKQKSPARVLLFEKPQRNTQEPETVRITLLVDDDLWVDDRFTEPELFKLLRFFDRLASRERRAPGR